MKVCALEEKKRDMVGSKLTITPGINRLVEILTTLDE